MTAQVELGDLVDNPGEYEKQKTENEDREEFSDFGRFTFDTVGDSIQGILSDKFQAQHGEGIILKVDEDKGRVIYPNTVMSEKLQQVNIGDKILIALTELKDTGKPNPLKIYSVWKRD